MGFIELCASVLAGKLSLRPACWHDWWQTLRNYHNKGHVFGGLKHLKIPRFVFCLMERTMGYAIFQIWELAFWAQEWVGIPGVFQ
jgi:hypothetical protein